MAGDRRLIQSGRIAGAFDFGRNLEAPFSCLQALETQNTSLAPFLAPSHFRAKRLSPKTLLAQLKRGLPAPMDHLVDKADLTPSPLKGQAATGAV